MREDGDDGFGGVGGAAAPAVAFFEAAAPLPLEAEMDAVDLEVACGTVDVKRVASLTVREPILDAMAVVVVVPQLLVVTGRGKERCSSGEVMHAYYRVVCSM